jgi:menaquinone-dependent protoporphyrinogen oxidase
MRAAIFFATREGQTRKIADHVAAALRTRQADVDLYDVRALPPAIEWSRYDWAAVAASVHGGHHEREMIAFVKAHRRELDERRAAFVSVTLSEAGAEDERASPAHREKSAADVQQMIAVFVQETGWHPAHVLPVAGALAYSRYNFVIKFVMRRIARNAGAPTDTSRDYEFTNWSRLDEFIDDVCPGLSTAASPA